MCVIRRYSLILTLLAAFLFVSACGASQTSAPTQTTPTTASQSAGMEHDMSAMPSTGPYDVLFIDSMIMHHQGAIDMANQALKEATKSEIKTLAENIIKAQESEIKQMQDWRKDRYPNQEQTAGLGMDMGTMEISSDAGKPFDQRFIEAMIPHHQGAIGMAKDAQQKAEHEEIKKLAAEIITAQEAEITQMQQWLKDWYGQ